MKYKIIYKAYPQSEMEIEVERDKLLLSDAERAIIHNEITELAQRIQTEFKIQTEQKT